MRSTILGGLTAAAVIAAGLALPQAQAQKLYRWVDEDGKVHYSQSLPPEAVDRARRELSARSGRATGEVDRALTEEERAAAAAEEAILEASRRLAEERAQRDQVLVASYPDETQLRRAYEERFALVDETLKATRVSIDSQRQSLASLLASAADRELGGQPVNEPTRAMIRETWSRLSSQQSLMNRRELERAALEQEYQETLARYRELRGGAPAGDEAGAGPGQAEG